MDDGIFVNYRLRIEKFHQSRKKNELKIDDYCTKAIKKSHLNSTSDENRVAVRKQITADVAAESSTISSNSAEVSDLTRADSTKIGSQVNEDNSDEEESKHSDLDDSDYSDDVDKSIAEEDGSDGEFVADTNSEEVETVSDGFYDAFDEPDHVCENGLYVPMYIIKHLYEYQREGLEWLWGLHEKETGGILADEMGLGKTVQIASFIACLLKGQTIHNILLVCPASVLFHWVREFQKWCPLMRAVVFHKASSAMMNKTPSRVVDDIVKTGGVLILTYEALRQHEEYLLSRKWDYAILDEGHRIRNPDAGITLVCKQINTSHRIILTGSPIQNHLRELWSLFDFISPGRLGTLPTFEDEFVLPIRHGAYMNASDSSILLAYKCASMLQGMIKPYLLRRMKKDLNISTKLPDKTENILFCTLTHRQRDAYEEYLASSEVQMVLSRATKPFKAIGVLRKICNHTEMVGRTVPSKRKRIEALVNGSGKLRVAHKLFTMWKKEGNKVLLFSQTRKMLSIIEEYVQLRKWKYSRLDGTTSVKRRQALIDQFNNPNSDIFIFLLTTRAGGIGINLVGANRVVIYDPDWNPSTDTQARERAWRLGQLNAVSIYRLITCGTIEEKIYHRQIFKQYLTQKVLSDPKKKRKFNQHHLHDLFTLSDSTNGENSETGTETGDLYLAGHVDTSSNLEASKGNTSQSDDEDIKKINSQLMKQLFDGGSIRSAFNHEALESDDLHNLEKSLVSMESSRVAKEALRHLKSSQRNVVKSRTGINVPTWTGRHGSAGVPVALPSRPPVMTPEASSSISRSISASANLLTKIRMRNIQPSTPPVIEANKRRRMLTTQELAAELRTFLLARNQFQSTTKRILEEFHGAVSMRNKGTFRQLLRNLADSSAGVWTLKEEYR